NCADDDHFDQTANTSVNNQLPWKRLDGVKTHAHADRRNFQQKTKLNSRYHAAAGETARVDRHERKNDQRLTDNDPVKQTQHFTLRPPEIWRLRINIFEHNAVKQPAPEEYKNVGGDECEDESLHELL